MQQQTRVAVMGAGSWGTAFAMLCVDAGSDVTLWARRAEVVEAVRDTRRHPDYLSGIDLPTRLRITADPEQAMTGADLVVLAVPSHALSQSLGTWRGLVPPDAAAVSLVKGIALDTRQRASQVIASGWDLPRDRIVVVSGPNLALECARRMPGGTVVASVDPDRAAQVQMACHTPYFRAYTNTDVVGVELGGAVKNAIAIAAGMADGLGYGDNTKAMLITRGLAEMTRLGIALGAQPVTFSGMAGMGDLVATCMSPQSRNRGVGEALGRGRSIDAIVADMQMVAEGVRSSPAILQIAGNAGVDMPIVEQVVRVVQTGADPREVAGALMGRSPKEEFHSFGEHQTPARAAVR